MIRNLHPNNSSIPYLLCQPVDFSVTLKFPQQKPTLSRKTIARQSTYNRHSINNLASKKPFYAPEAVVDIHVKAQHLRLFLVLISY